MKDIDLNQYGDKGLKDTGLVIGKVPSVQSTDTGIKKPEGNTAAVKPAKSVMAGPVTPIATKKPVAYDAETGGYAIRQSLNNAGIKDDDIKWDGTYVTVGSKKYLPSKNRNGVTFASKEDINSFINEIYKEKGTPLKQANAYANEYGLTGLLDWNPSTRQVTIDGKPVDYAYIDDGGNAWVREDILENAFSEAAERRGMVADSEAREEYYSSIDAAAKERAAIDKRISDFDYTAEDVRNDPEYKALAEIYRNNALESFLTQYNELAARNGGNLSSAAVQAAGETYNRNMEGLNSVAAGVRDKAYARMMDTVAAERDANSRKREDAYNKLAITLDANERAINRNETVKADERNRVLTEQQSEANKLTLDNAEKEAAYNNARRRGFYTAQEAELLGVDVNSSPYAADAESQRYIWDEVGKQQLMDQAEIQSGVSMSEFKQKDMLERERAAEAYTQQIGLMDKEAAIEKDVYAYKKGPT